MNELMLKQFLECIDYHITDSSQYLWQCYGNDAVCLDTWNGKHGPEGRSIHCVFDSKTSEVYEMQAWDYRNNREYRWIHPDFREDYKDEADSRGVNSKQSFDDREFIEIEEIEDILEKARAIFLGKDYDTRIIIKLELTDDEEMLLMRAAHVKDMSVNQFIEHILEEEIARHRNQTAA